MLIGYIFLYYYDHSLESSWGLGVHICIYGSVYIQTPQPTSPFQSGHSSVESV